MNRNFNNVFIFRRNKTKRTNKTNKQNHQNFYEIFFQNKVSSYKKKRIIIIKESAKTYKVTSDKTTLIQTNLLQIAKFYDQSSVILNGLYPNKGEES